MKIFLAALLAAIVAGGLAFAQTGGPVPPVEENPGNWLAALLAMSGAFLPLVGRILSMIPFVSNKLIPAVNTALAVGAKYWLLMGFPLNAFQDVGMSGDHGVALAGLSLKALGALAWGVGEQGLSMWIYESTKRRARENASLGMAAPLLAKLLVPQKKRVPVRV